MPVSINLSLLAGSFGFKLPTLFENTFFKKNSCYYGKLSLLAGSFGFKLPTLFENTFLKKTPAIMESILFIHDR